MSKRKAAETIENSVTKILKRDNIGKAHKWLEGKTATPYQELVKTLENRQVKKPVDNGDCVLHWFRSDLRIQDNRALSRASKLAQSLNKPLITLYIVSAKEFESHFLSDVKIDLIVRTLLNLQKKLKQLNIPLIIDSIGNRDFCSKLDEVCENFKVSNVFANYEYEIDELRRDTKVAKGLDSKGSYLELCHDACIVEPELIKSKTGTAYKVFKAWYNDWSRRVYNNRESYLKLEDPPSKNENTIKVPPNKIELHDLQRPDSATADHMKSLYTDDEDEVLKENKVFIKQRLDEYEDAKDYPALDKSSLMSPYINIGSISTRRIVKDVFEYFEGTNSNSVSFVREVAWRDFYRHKIVEFPHVVMGMPFNLKTANLEWENDTGKFEKWCKGETGFAIVDASMKKLNKDRYMSNRCRMIVSNFLVKNLLVDWRYGEQYFMSKLIDGDFASNNGGWGFVSSTGVNCQPFFRVFNPELQQKHYDPELEFIRDWIPNYDPDNYIEPIVDYKATKEIFIENFRKTM